MKQWIKRGVFCFLIGLVIPAEALTPAINALTVKTASNGTTTYSISMQILFIMTALTVLPTFVLALTSFTRIMIVLAVLRQAMGMATTPTNQILIILALLLTLFVMMPVMNRVNETALQPYLKEKITFEEAVQRAEAPFRNFMLNQTRDADLDMFVEISGKKDIKSVEEVPFLTLMPAFLTSELKTAFQMGFVIFLPFLVIDLVVSSVLMAMGMMMLSPLIISLPFKILLFVMVDGWSLLLGTLAGSFGT